MRRILALVLLVLLALATGGALAADEVRLVNAGFETGPASGGLSGWFVPPAVRAGGYDVRIVEDEPAEGRRRLLLVRTGEETTPSFGNAIQSIDAKPLRGRTVRLTAKVRAAGGGRAQIWMRADLAKGGMGFFDNMADRPVLEDDWTLAEITGRVDDDAAELVFGVMLLGPGTAGADDFKLEVVKGDEESRAEAPRPLTDAGLTNLTAFARLFGLVRHFHPTDQAARAEYGRFAIAGVRAVEGARSPAELAAALSAAFAPLAPTLRVAPSATEPLPPAGAPSDATTVVSWRHRGFGKEAAGGIYRSERVRTPLVDGKVPAGAVDPRDAFVADLGGGVTAWVPLAVFADVRGTLPRPTGDVAGARLAALRTTADDRATRLADVVIAWNVYQHFYPYFDVVKCDWARELTTALRRAATDAGEAAFTATLRRLVAATHDGHGFVACVRDPRNGSLPLAWDWAEEKLVVTAADPAADPRIVPGTVVESLGGRPAPEVLASIEEEVSAATPQWARHLSLSLALRGLPGTSVKLACRPPEGEAFTADLAFTVRQRPVAPKRLDPIANLGEGIWYLDVDRITTRSFEEVSRKLLGARGIAIDFRGYPSNVDAFKFFGHFIDKPVQSALWNVPVFTRPDQQGRTFETSRWTVPPLAPQIAAKLAFVTGGGAISYAESCMGIVEAYGLGEIVGGPTAGTNGNVNSFLLPGGFSISWTGMQVLKHDGTSHHGVGIRPTVPVTRTVAGIAAGRDEVLERALERLKE